MASVNSGRDVTPRFLVKDALQKLAKDKDDAGAMTQLIVELNGVSTGAAAENLTTGLSVAQKKALQGYVGQLQLKPEVKAFFDAQFKDTRMGAAPATADRGRVKSQPVAEGRSDRIAAGKGMRGADADAVNAKLTPKDAGAKDEPAAADAKKRAKPTVVKADAEAKPGKGKAAKTSADAVAPDTVVDTAAADSAAPAQTPPESVDETANATGAAAESATERLGPAANTDAPNDGSGDRQGQAGEPPPFFGPLDDDTFGQILGLMNAMVDPQRNAAYQEANVQAHQLDQMLSKYNGLQSRLTALRQLPAAQRKAPEIDAEIKRLETELKGAPNAQKTKAALEKVASDLQNMPSRLMFAQLWDGLNLPGDVRGARLAMNPDTKEGRMFLAIFNEIAGRPSELTPEQKNKLKAYLASPEGKNLLAVQPGLEIIRTLRQSKVPANLQMAALGDVLRDVADGRPVNPQQWENFAKMWLPQMPNGEVPGAAGGGPPNGSGGGPSSPGGPGGPGGPSGPGNGAPFNSKWFDARDPNWFGMSRVRADELKNNGHIELYNAIQEYHEKMRATYMASAGRLGSMMSVLKSGMPIEAVILIFMGLMVENEEEKLKLKMAEIVVAEQFERTNNKLKADQNFARDLWRKYQSGEVKAGQGENTNPEQIEKMAGLTWTQSVSDEAAAEKNTRGRLMEDLRTEDPQALRSKLAEKIAKNEDKDDHKIVGGMNRATPEAVQKRLAAIEMKADGTFDEDKLKSVGLTSDRLKAAGVKTADDLAVFKAEAAGFTDSDVAEHIAQQPVKREARFIDVTLNPSDFGFSNKPSQALVQELQVQMQNYKQMMETFTAVIRMLQDIVSAIARNIR